jgi:hypothetical protein
MCYSTQIKLKSKNKEIKQMKRVIYVITFNDFKIE